MTIRSSIFSENFTGVTPPALPASVTADSGVTTVASSPIGTGNALRHTGTSNVAKYWDSASSGNADGNDHYSVVCRASNVDGTVINLLFSYQSTFQSSGSGTGYIFQAGHTDVDPQVTAIVAGTLGSAYTQGTVADFEADVNYTVDIQRAFDDDGDGFIQILIKRSSDNKYHRVNFDGSGTWDTGKTYFFDIANTEIAAGAAKVGGGFFNLSVGTVGYVDTIQFDRAWPIGYHFWGDSQTQSSQATEGSYAQKAGDTLGTSIQNHGIGGMMIGDIVGKMYAAKWGGHKAVIFACINDSHDFGYGLSTTRRDTYSKRALRAAILSAAMPNKKKATEATPTGSWTGGSGPVGYEADVLMVSSTSGDKLSFSSMTGDVLYALYTAYEDQTGTFDIKLAGGATLGSASSNGGTSGSPTTSVKLTSITNRLYSPQAIRLTGAGSGSHTIEMVLTNSGLSIIDGLISLENNSSMNAVYVCTLPHIVEPAYTTYFSSHANLIAANAWIDTYNTMIADVVSELAGDGIPVTLVNFRDVVDPSTDLTADGLHFDNDAHTDAAAALVNAINASSSAVASGTITAAIDEDDIVSGGKILTLTLTGDTWVAAGAPFNAIRQDIIDGIDSAQSEADGWDAVVKAGLSTSAVVRTSSTVVTITLPAFASYDITAPETITATIPGSALIGGVALVASPNFVIDDSVGGSSVTVSGTITASIDEDDIRTGGKVLTLTLAGDTWVAGGSTFNTQRQNIIDGLDSAQAEGSGWDAVVKATMDVTAVVRTSATVVTITLPAFGSYNITAQETITATIPGTALVGGSPLVATPTFTIDSVAAGSALPLLRNLFQQMRRA